MDITTQEKIQLFFKHKRAGIGLIITVLSIPVMLIYAGDADFKAIQFHLNEVKEIEGYIDFIGDTDFEEEDEIIQEFGYTFVIPETSEAFKGTSYSAYKIGLKPSEKISIEYIEDNPYISRIKDMDSAPYSFWKVIFIGAIILYGYLMLLIAFISWRVELRKVKNGNP